MSVVSAITRPPSAMRRCIINVAAGVSVVPGSGASLGDHEVIAGHLAVRAGMVSIQAALDWRRGECWCGSAIASPWSVNWLFGASMGAGPRALGAGVGEDSSDSRFEGTRLEVTVTDSIPTAAAPVLTFRADSLPPDSDAITIPIVTNCQRDGGAAWPRGSVQHRLVHDGCAKRDETLFVNGPCVFFKVSTNMPDQIIVESFEKQFGRSWNMLREVVNRLNDDQWHKGGDTWTDVPSRSAYHVVQCAEFYIWEGTAEEFDWERNGTRPWDSPPEQLPSRQDLLRYIDRIEADTNAWLHKQRDSGLLGSNEKEPKYCASALERMLYALRHLQHHVAQISQESKRRGYGAAEWR